MSIFAYSEAAGIVALWWRRAKIALVLLVALGLVGIGASYYDCAMHDSKEADK